LSPASAIAYDGRMTWLAIGFGAAVVVILAAPWWSLRNGR
jgi:hypothetical protein